MAANDEDIGFEEAMSWLPSHILHDACGSGHLNQEPLGCHTRYYQHHCHANCYNSSLSLAPGEQWRNRRKSHTRSRYMNNSNNRTSGGPGMQAVFLEPAHKSCGTGVFLPRRVGTQLKPTKNLGCSPVLLPYRVVQALNLNVHALGLQISSHEGQVKKHHRGRVGYHSSSSRNVEDWRDNCDMISNNSPELSLPNEWSY